MRGALLKTAGALALSSGALVAFIGFAHTGPGRPLLAYIPGFGDAGCPVGADVSPEVRDASRASALAPFQGDVPAQARPALGLALDAATRDDVRAWSANQRGMCIDEGTDLRCSDAAHGDVLLRFDAAGRLVSLDATFTLAEAGATATRFLDRSGKIAAAAGPPTQTRGEATAAFLDAGPLSQALAQFHYRDYKADVIATNLGHGRFKVREVVQSIPN